MPAMQILQPPAGKKLGKALPFSISSLTAYETCPKRYYITKIAKAVSEPQTQATIHGNDVHRALEHAVKGDKGLGKYSMYQSIVDRVRAAPGVKETERNFCVDRNFRPVDYWAANAWARGKIDLTVTNGTTALVLDWKTGKPKNDDTGQLKLTAAAVFAEKPFLEKVITGYVWLANDRIDTETYLATDVPEIWASFLPRVNRMSNSMEKMDFPARPSGLCREWCPVGKALCEHCGKD